MAEPTGTDVIVVGAGLAGATAAEELAERGLKVTVLEARDRTGGRGYMRAFGGDGEPVDFGGSWITPWQQPIRSLCRKHGVALRPRHPVTSRRWYRDGGLHVDGPVAAKDLRAHEKALARIALDVHHLREGRQTDETGRPLGVSFADYLTRIGAPEATRHICSAWWVMSGNGPHDRVPATEFLGSCGHSDGTPEGICEVWVESLEGGVNGLAARMIASSGAELRLNAPVTAVAHDAHSVTVTLASGERMAARSAILATGLNMISGIGFDPPLPQAKAEAARIGHLGRAIKVWVKAEGVEVGTLATGDGRAIEWMFAERGTRDGATMLVGFGLQRADFDPGSREQVSEATLRLFPEARVLAHDWHDWIADPYSRGTWVNAVIGAEAGALADNWRCEARLAFASSDIAAEGAGWFDAAVISGRAAAGEIARLLGRN
jgi:monoamine oxidase